MLAAGHPDRHRFEFLNKPMPMRHLLDRLQATLGA